MRRLDRHTMPSYGFAMFKKSITFMVALISVLLAGCSAGDGEGKPNLVCAPGKTESCACVGATTTGAQTCSRSGEAWGTCKCPGDVSAGGDGNRPVTQCTPGDMQECSCNHCRTPGYKTCDDQGNWGAVCTSDACERWIASGQPDCAS